MGNRCTGNCCKMFYLPYSPDELKFSYEAWLRLRTKEDEPIGMSRKVSGGLARSGPSILWDIHLIYPMVRYLGKMKPPEGMFTFNHPESHFYRCVHFTPSPDGEGGSCGIYDFRPAMCREHPYGETCKYTGCTWDEKSEVKNPTPRREESFLIAKGEAVEEAPTRKDPA